MAGLRMTIAPWQFCLILALVPAVFAWWRDRMLVRRLDDPALPARLHSNARTTGLVLGLAFAGLLLNWPREATWAIPLSIVARMAAGFPLRRRVHDETWSFGRYLWFFIRLTTAWSGFWLLLAFAPT